MLHILLGIFQLVALRSFVAEPMQCGACSWWAMPRISCSRPELDYVTGSRAASMAMAENDVGLPLG